MSADYDEVPCPKCAGADPLTSPEERARGNDCPTCEAAPGYMCRVINPAGGPPNLPHGTYHGTRTCALCANTGAVPRGEAANQLLTEDDADALILGAIEAGLAQMAPIIQDNTLSRVFQDTLFPALQLPPPKDEKWPR